jgi:hypothetical protein
MSQQVRKFVLLTLLNCFNSLKALCSQAYPYISLDTSFPYNSCCQRHPHYLRRLSEGIQLQVSLPVTRCTIAFLEYLVLKYSHLSRNYPPASKSSTPPIRALSYHYCHRLSRSLMACPNIDGFLVGGASLLPEFVDIMKVGVT